MQTQLVSVSSGDSQELTKRLWTVKDLYIPRVKM